MSVKPDPAVLSVGEITYRPLAGLRLIGQSYSPSRSDAAAGLDSF